MTNAAPPTLSEAHLQEASELVMFSLILRSPASKRCFLIFPVSSFNTSLFFQSLMEKLEKENEDEMGHSTGQSQAELCIPSQTDLFQVRI